MQTDTDPTLQLELSIFRGDSLTAVARVQLTDTGCVFDPEITREEWREGLRTIKEIRGRADLIIADYVKFGELQWGRDAVLEAMQQLEFQMPEVRRLMDINSVPAEIRKPNLTPDHYVILGRADIPLKQKAKWAGVASEQRLTPTQLKASIEAGEVVDVQAARQMSHGVISVHGIHQEFTIWLKRVGGIEGLLALDQENRMEVWRQLDRIVEVGLKLRESLQCSTTSQAS